MKKKTLFDSFCRAFLNSQGKSTLIPALTVCFAFSISGLCNSQSNAQSIPWHPDIAAATQVAKEQNKLILLHFTAEWCKPCRNLETFVFASPGVQRAIAQNVVAVKIDVDSESHLVQEYGVASVPFDVAITPTGRVVLKRKSPREAATYTKMISDLHTVINTLNQGDAPALNQNLAELEKAIQDRSPKFEGQPTSFTPEAPSYQAPKPSVQSAELKRNSRFISNPYIQPPTPETGQQVSNAFTPAPESSQNSSPVKPPAEFAPAGKFESVSNFRPTGDFAPSGNFPPSRNLAPSGNFTPSAKLAPAGNFRPTPTQASNPSPQQNTFVPIANAEKIDNRGFGSTPNENGFQGRRGQVQKNRFVTQTPLEPTPFQQAQPSPQRPDGQTEFQSNVADQRFERPNNRSIKVTELAQPRPGTTRVKPKVVMNDQYFGNPSTTPAETVPPSPNSQAKINLTNSEPTDFVPDGPIESGKNSHLKVAANLSNDDNPEKLVNQTEIQSAYEQKAHAADKVAFEQQAQPTGTTATPAASSTINSHATDTTQPAAAGMHMAAPKTTQPKYALHGKCPLTLLRESKWVDGNPKWGCIHRNRVYIFTSEQNLRLFQADPDANSPILAGYDPVIYRETGKLVDGVEKHGVFMGKPPQQRIVLFANAETRARFQSEPKKYLESVRQAMLNTGSSSKLLR